MRKHRVFSLIIVFVLVIILPINSFASDNFGSSKNIIEISKIKPNSDGNYEYVYTGKETKYDVRIGYHPSFNKPERADFYYFSSSKQVGFEISVSLLGIVTGKVDAGASSSSGYGITADSSRWSRPCIFGDVTTYYYDLIIRDDIGNIINVVKVKESTASKTYIKAVYD